MDHPQSALPRSSGPLLGSPSRLHVLEKHGETPSVWRQGLLEAPDDLAQVEQVMAGSARRYGVGHGPKGSATEVHVASRCGMMLPAMVRARQRRQRYRESILLLSSGALRGASGLASGALRGASG